MPVLAFAPAAAPAANLLDTAQAANGPGGAFEGQLDTLIAAVLAADPAVAEALVAPGQRTVFAPTDDAFLDAGLNPDNVGSAFSQGELTEILLYHVVPGKRMAGSVVNAKQLRTAAREFISVSGTELTDAIGRTSSILVTDIETDNGVIHVIGGVLLPFAP